MRGSRSSSGSARGRILDAAYKLFCQHGIRAVGIDSVIERSGVARMTLYRHFESKDALVLAVLEQRDVRFQRGWFQTRVERMASTPAGRLLAIFDVLDEWFRQPDFEGCTFVKVILEIADPENPLSIASQSYLVAVRKGIAHLASRAGIADPETFAREWHMLIKGATIAASEGDREAAVCARTIAELLLARRLRDAPEEEVSPSH